MESATERASGTKGDRPKLMEDEGGMVFEYLDEQEAEFLYEEVFVRRSYLQHGLTVQDDAVVVDAGANVGLFSLQCLQKAKAVQVFAFEPIPVIYEVLARNLHSIEAIKTGTSPKPVMLRVALGAQQNHEVFTYFSNNPGESTRHPQERETQQGTLSVDAEAIAWRKSLPTASEVGGERAMPHAVGTTTDTKEQGDETVSTDADERRDQPGAQLTSQADFLPSSAVEHESRQGKLVAALRVKSEEEKMHVQAKENGNVAATTKEETSQINGAGTTQTFVCSVVPLSLALRELSISCVDLLKVDVEGDELAVLQGISRDDWPKIHQVVLEVHDIDGRLGAIVDLLRSATAGDFDEVCWEAQATSEVGGYVMIVPEALRMFFVFAKRRKKLEGQTDKMAVPITTGSTDNDQTLTKAEKRHGEVPVVTREELEVAGSRNSVGTSYCCCTTSTMVEPSI